VAGGSVAGATVATGFGAQAPNTIPQMIKKPSKCRTFFFTFISYIIVY
jgi:hypothetical protein